MDQPTQVAVVGATGFIGTAVVRDLRRAGMTVVPVTRAEPVLNPDGTLQQDVLGIGAVVWAAASTNPAIAEERPDLVAADLSAVQDLISALESARSDARVIYLSSGGTVYDPSARAPFTESSRCAPQGAYGRGKLDIEHAVLSHPGGVVLRIANAYGPGQPVAPGQGVLAHWLHAIDAGRPIVVFGNLDTARDYVYIDDIAAAVTAAVRAADLPPILNIGSGRPTTLGELLEAVRGLTGDVQVEYREGRRFDVSRTWLDVTAAADALGWRPDTALADGIRSAWASVRTR